MCPYHHWLTSCSITRDTCIMPFSYRTTKHNGGQYLPSTHKLHNDPSTYCILALYTIWVPPLTDWLINRDKWLYLYNHHYTLSHYLITNDHLLITNILIKLSIIILTLVRLINIYHRFSSYLSHCWAWDSSTVGRRLIYDTILVGRVDIHRVIYRFARNTGSGEMYS